MQYIHILSGHPGFFFGMNICDYRYGELFCDLLQDAKCFFIPDACKGIYPGSVGFAVGGLKDKRQLIFFREGINCFSNFKGHFPAFHHTRTGNQNKTIFISISDGWQYSLCTIIPYHKTSSLSIIGSIGFAFRPLSHFFPECKIDSPLFRPEDNIPV